MNQLTPLIESLALRLHKLPEPVRMQIISEAVSDMQDYYDYLRAHNKTESEAVQMVKNKFVFSEQDINQLCLMHTHLANRVLGFLGGYGSKMFRFIILTGIVIYCFIFFIDYNNFWVLTR